MTTLNQAMADGHEQAIGALIQDAQEVAEKVLLALPVKEVRLRVKMQMESGTFLGRVDAMARAKGMTTSVLLGEILQRYIEEAWPFTTA